MLLFVVEETNKLYKELAELDEAEMKKSLLIVRNIMEKERKYYIEDIEQGLLIEVTKEQYEEFHERIKQMFKAISLF